MKKVFRCLGMMALVALAFTSCKKNEEQTTFKASAPQLIIEDEDRAYVDGLVINFEVNDRVMIMNINETAPEESHCANYKAIQQGSHVEFVNAGEGTVGIAEDGGYYAYYPSFLVQVDEWDFQPDRIITELEFGENKSKFYVSPDQEYRENLVPRKDFYLAGHTTQAQAPTLADADFQMKSICGVLELKPYEAAQRTVTSIEIVDNFFTLTGWTELIVPEIDADEMMTLFNGFDPTSTTWMDALNTWKTETGFNVTGPGKGNSVTLHMPAGGVQLGATKATTPAFNIVLRPLALTYGCHIIFTFDDGNTKDIDLSTKNLKIKPNTVKTVGLNMDNY